MNVVNDTARRLHQQAPLTDIHVHPSLKAYLWNRNLWRHYQCGSVFNPFSSRSDFSCLSKGGVGVIWAAHHLVERQLFRDIPVLHLSFMFPIYWKLTRGSLMRRLEEMIDKLEKEIMRRPDRTELACSASDIRRIHAAGKIAIVHTVEGGHILEGKPENLDKLAQRGVAMLTLCHFYQNGLAAQVVAIPNDYAITKIFKLRLGAFSHPALTDFGRAVIRRMQELKMLVDVTHCTPEARAAVYAELLFGAVNTLIFCRRILNVLFQKVIPDNMRLALTFVHVTSNIADHFFQGSGTSSPQSIALDILVDQFVRI